jgi:hypothetical protein
MKALLRTLLAVGLAIVAIFCTTQAAYRLITRQGLLIFIWSGGALFFLTLAFIVFAPLLGEPTE